MSVDILAPPEHIQPLLRSPSEDSPSDAPQNKPDRETPAPPPGVHGFPTNPHFDLASSSSTAYIALVAPEAIPSSPEPRGPLASFFHRNLGLFLIAAAQMFFAVMNLCAKLLSMKDPPIDPFEIIFVRMLITWVGAVSYLHYSKIPDYFIGPKGVRL